MVDRDAVAELLAAYAAANDVRDARLVAGCFTEDASFTLHIAGAPTIGPLEPRDALVAFFAAAFAEQDDQRRHVVTNLRLLERAEDRARGEAYLTLIVTDGGSTTLQSAGRYDIEVVRDGAAWRFRAMTLHLDSPF